MWIQVLILCLSLWSQSRAQQGAGDQAGQCRYTFTVSRPVESSCSGGSMTAEQLDGVLYRLTLLEALVSRLMAGVGGSTGAEVTGEEVLQEAYTQVTLERNQLEQEKESLNKQVLELQRRLDEQLREADRLKQKACPQTPAPPGAPAHPAHPQLQAGPATEPEYNSGSGAYQEMKAEVTEVPASHLLPGGNQSWSGCGDLLSVGDPVVHMKADSITGKYGVWLKDPEPQGAPYTNSTVWRIDAVGKEVLQLFAYEDLDQFSQGFPMKVLVLPEPIESTGATVYRGSLYYQRKRSRTLIRYDLASESLAARLDLPHAGFHGQYPYSWGGYTDIDLAVDEQGLWVIYSTSKARGAIVVSQLDPGSLEVRKTLDTKIRKNTVANAFMICGRLYTVASYTAPNTTINYMFDTASRTGHALSVPFKNRYRYNSMVDYNHADRKLYAWDNFHMVTYDVTLGRANRRGSAYKTAHATGKAPV